MPTERLSNVIGAPFSQFVLDQLKIRTRRNSIGTGTNGTRSTDEILFLANKMSWVKLTSSVKINPNLDQYADVSDFYKSYGLDITKYTDDNSLRKNWILQAGTLYSGSTGFGLRTGLGPEGAYGMGGTVNSGYRPMPGLTNVSIESKGVLGSLREANLEFKVWNIEQLDVIEALYFRLGYSMILEWGHVQYYANTSDRSVDGVFKKSDGGIDVFTDTRKEGIQQAIAKKRKNTFGNYDGMLGVVSNFTWSFNKEGGYDCTLKIIGLGSIIDTLRINLSYKMPNAIFIEYEKQQKSIERSIREAAEREEKRKQKQLQSGILAQQQKAAQASVAGLPALPTSKSTIYPIYEYDVKKNNPPKPLLNRNEFIEQNQYYSQTTSVVTPSINITNQPILNVLNVLLSSVLGDKNPNSFISNVYYKATGTDNIRLNNKRTGLFLTQPFNWIPADVAINYPQPVEVDTKAITNRINYIFNEFGKTKFAGLNLPNAPLDGFDLVFSNNLVTNTTLANYIEESDKLDFVTILKTLTGFNSKLQFGLDTRYLGNRSQGNGLNNEIAIDFYNVFLADVARYGGFGQQQSVAYTYEQKVPIQTVNGVVQENRYFYFVIKYVGAQNDKYTKTDISKYINDWFNSPNPVLNINAIESTNYVIDKAGFEVLLKLFPGITLGVTRYKDLIINGTIDLRGLVPAGQPTPTIQITTNDPFFITKILPRPDPTLTTPMNGEGGGGGNTFIFVNNSTPEQKDEAQKFASALHAMLYAVKSKVQTDAGKGNLKSKSGGAVDILTITKNFFVDGILYGVLDSSTSTASDSGTPFKVIPYARKGFNSSLMVNPELFNTITNVDFKALCTAYYIKFKIENNTNPYNYPVYIKFGYLLAFLNSMCLIYDSKQDTDKRPYVYLDFHPEYNFCLTTPYHLSVDPLTCMIPYQGTDEQYKELFPKEISQTIFAKENSGLTSANNDTSKFLTGFKNKDNKYQGKTMEILISIDFLLDTLRSFTTNDPTHAINLKGFLDAVVVGINKSCGNINMFRVSYDDDSNTVVIKDDQFVPNRADEPNTLSRPGYTSNSNVDPMYGMIPIFGLNSMVREFEFKTNINTAMSKKIAISAQRTPDAVNSTDHTSYSYLNIDFEDAYKPQVTDSTKLTSTSNIETNKEALKNDIDQANKFNSHVLAIYTDNQYLSPGRIDFSINYYINSMADRKSLDVTTYASQFIPANLSMTIDGISGIVMGNAFTVPEDRLPRSLRGNGVRTKVGFIVSGLMHTLDNNQWLTKIKGQMIRLQDIPKKQTAQPNIKKPTEPVTTVVPKTTPTTIPECPDFWEDLYSGAPLVPETESINTQNVKQYYPTINFVRGTSDIPVTTNVPLLNDNEIIDDTRFNRFDLGILDTGPRPYINLYINSTYSLDSPDIKKVYEDFYCTGKPSQYVIDLQGNIHRFLPDGMKGVSKAFGDGIEIRIVSQNASSANDLQIRNAARLIRYLGYNREPNIKLFVFLDKLKVFLENL
jgi:hypothetical protein